MKRLFLAGILFFGGAGFLCADVVVTLPHPVTIIKDASFYVADVIDERTNKREIGSAMVGMINTREP